MGRTTIGKPLPRTLANHPFMRVLMLCIVAFALVLPQVSGAAYMKIGDIKGEAVDRTDGGASISDDVASWSFTATQDRDGRNRVSDIVVVRQMDHASPKLMQSMATGESLGSVELGTTDRYGEAYLVIRMEDALVSSYHLSSSSASDADDRPTEEVAFYYNKISFEYRPTQDQRADTTIVFTGLE